MVMYVHDVFYDGALHKAIQHQGALYSHGDERGYFHRRIFGIFVS